MGAQLEAIGPIGLRATLQLVKQAKNRRKWWSVMNHLILSILDKIPLEMSCDTQRKKNHVLEYK